MPNFKFIYIWIFLIAFIGGKMYSEVCPYNFLADSKEQKKELTIKTKKASDTAKAKYNRQRNRKARCIGTAIPQISEIYFSGFHIYKTYKLSHTESVYTSFLYCIRLKRGPPFA